MSAYMVSREHIDALVQVAIEGPKGTARSGWSGLRYFARPLRPDTTTAELQEITIRVVETNASVVGQMLAAENARSLRARYQDADESGMVAEWADNGYQWKRHVNRLSAVECIKAIHCYNYQACEAREWHGSEAEQFCLTLLDRVSMEVPGYDNAAGWDVTPELVGPAVISFYRRRGGR